MPLYDFRCNKCGHKFTVLTGVSERDKVTCPECSSREVEQLISACAVRTGSGCSGAGTSGSAGFRGG